MLQYISVYARWWKMWKTLPVKPWVRAAELYRAGQFAKAAPKYLEGIQKRPHHPARFSARLDLAFCLTKVGKFDAAKEHLHHVVGFEPRMREGHLRLGKLQIWLGHTVEAAWTFRRALQKITPDPEMAGLFFLTALESIGSTHLIQEAEDICAQLTPEQVKHPLIQLAYAKHELLFGDREIARQNISDATLPEHQTVESLIAFAELLLEEQKSEDARYHLQRALSLRPDFPRTLFLLAQTYLKSGDSYNSPFALQLAQGACQASGWKNPGALYVLADAYLHFGDKVSALLIASKAKDVGASLLGSYREEVNVEQLIAELSSGTQG